MQIFIQYKNSVNMYEDRHINRRSKYYFPFLLLFNARLNLKSITIWPQGHHRKYIHNFNNIFKVQRTQYIMDLKKKLFFLNKNCMYEKERSIYILWNYFLLCSQKILRVRWSTRVSQLKRLRFGMERRII